MTKKNSPNPSQKRLLTLISILIISFVNLALPSFLSPPTINAQTEEPDWGDIRGIRAIVALPAAVSFRVRLMELTNDQVARVTLTVQQNEETIHQVDLDLDNSIFLDYITEVEYEYNWVDLADEPVELFQPIYYEFEVETLEGVISNAGEEIPYEHLGFGEWQMTEVDNVTLRYYDENFPAESQAANLNQVLSLLSENIGFNEPVDMVVYDADAPLCIEQPNEETGEIETVVLSDGRPFPCSIESLAALYASQGIILAPIADPNFNTTENGLTQIIVDTVYTEKWGDADIPVWFKRGLILYYSPNGVPSALGLVQTAAQQDRLIRLPEMTSPTSQSELWDAQAYMLTLYLAENYGADAPFQLARELSEGTSFLAALDQIADASLDRIYSAWTLWVNTTRAQEVAVWNPYQPITPTPTATFTASPVPPTRTPTLTLTISLTPTNTLPYVPPTARVSRVPPTVIPTASNTPLPPGSFDISTPVPVSNNEEDRGGGGLCGTGIGAMVLPAAGLVLAWRRRERN